MPLFLYVASCAFVCLPFLLCRAVLRTLLWCTLFKKTLYLASMPAQYLFVLLQSLCFSPPFPARPPHIPRCDWFLGTHPPSDLRGFLVDALDCCCLSLFLLYVVVFIAASASPESRSTQPITFPLACHSPPLLSSPRHFFILSGGAWYTQGLDPPPNGPCPAHISK